MQQKNDEKSTIVPTSSSRVTAIELQQHSGPHESEKSFSPNPVKMSSIEHVIDKKKRRREDDDILNVINNDESSSDSDLDHEAEVLDAEEQNIGDEFEQDHSTSSHVNKFRRIGQTPFTDKILSHDDVSFHYTNVHPSVPTVTTVDSSTELDYTCERNPMPTHASTNKKGRGTSAEDDTILQLIRNLANFELDGPTEETLENCPVCLEPFNLDVFAQHVLECIRKLDNIEKRHLEDLDEKAALALAFEDYSTDHPPVQFPIQGNDGFRQKSFSFGAGCYENAVNSDDSLELDALIDVIPHDSNNTLPGQAIPTTMTESDMNHDMHSEMNTQHTQSIETESSNTAIETFETPAVKAEAFMRAIAADLTTNVNTTHNGDEVMGDNFVGKADDTQPSPSVYGTGHSEITMETKPFHETQPRTFAVSHKTKPESIAQDAKTAKEQKRLQMIMEQERMLEFYKRQAENRNKPLCSFGESCTITLPSHFREFKHPDTMCPHCNFGYPPNEIAAHLSRCSTLSETIKLPPVIRQPRPSFDNPLPTPTVDEMETRSHRVAVAYESPRSLKTKQIRPNLPASTMKLRPRTSSFFTTAHEFANHDIGGHDDDSMSIIPSKPAPPISCQSPRFNQKYDAVFPSMHTASVHSFDADNESNSSGNLRDLCATPILTRPGMSTGSITSGSKQALTTITTPMNTPMTSIIPRYPVHGFQLFTNTNTGHPTTSTLPPTHSTELVPSQKTVNIPFSGGDLDVGIEVEADTPLPHTISRNNSSNQQKTPVFNLRQLSAIAKLMISSTEGLPKKQFKDMNKNMIGMNTMIPNTGSGSKTGVSVGRRFGQGLYGCDPLSLIDTTISEECPFGSDGDAEDEVDGILSKDDIDDIDAADTADVDTDTDVNTDMDTTDLEGDEMSHPTQPSTKGKKTTKTSRNRESKGENERDDIWSLLEIFEGLGFDRQNLEKAQEEMFKIQADKKQQQK